jgi:ribosomal protein S18 acetylase RimI-like enzyme
MITLRKMESGDIPAGLQLCRAHGWNQLSPDLELFLRISPDGCRVAIDEGKIVGTVTTVSYESRFSWIGMVLVDPAYQRRGIGRQLLLEALEILSREETIKLDATPAGREVYIKLGFIDEYPLSRMLATAPAVPANHGSALVRPVQRHDLSSIAAFDRRIFGADRRGLLEWMWTGTPESCFLAEEGEEILGYCLGRNGHNYTQIGPVIAHDRLIAQGLVAAAIAAHAKPLIIDTPHHDPQWRAWLEAIGFAVQRPFMRMYRGVNHFKGAPQIQFAIAGPEFG